MLDGGTIQMTRISKTEVVNASSARSALPEALPFDASLALPRETIVRQVSPRYKLLFVFHFSFFLVS